MSVSVSLKKEIVNCKVRNVSKSIVILKKFTLCTQLHIQEKMKR